MTLRPKTEHELATMREGGKRLNEVLQYADSLIRPGMTLREIDEKLHTVIKQHGGTPSFLGYLNYPAATCLSLNDAVVHGIPDETVLKTGDVLGIDIGMFYDGYHTDAAFTKPLGKIHHEALQLLAVTQESLRIGIEAASSGNLVSSIGEAIENYIREQSRPYGIIRDLSGHGIGQKLQESPEILNHRNKNTTMLTNGLTIAIEPMITLGGWHVFIDAHDDWTVRTEDGSLAAHFETTIVIHDNDPEVLVSFPLDYRLP